MNVMCRLSCDVCRVMFVVLFVVSLVCGLLFDVACCVLFFVRCWLWVVGCVRLLGTTF